MSGASAGGMTAAIASLVLQLENKHHVKFLPDVKDKATLAELEEIENEVEKEPRNSKTARRISGGF